MIKSGSDKQATADTHVPAANQSQATLNKTQQLLLNSYCQVTKH